MSLRFTKGTYISARTLHPTELMIERPVRAEDPVITIVIPTIPENGHQNVVNILKKQTIDEEYEVIVVNDASVDICEARNMGIRKASAEIIALTDDDTRPPLDWAQVIVDVFDEHDIVCAEGPVTGGINYDGSRSYVGCNLSFLRDVALDIGGFDSDYAGWRDDTEFGWRMEVVGNCRYDKTIEMEHPPRPGSSYIHDNELKLREEFPLKYHEVMVENASAVERLYRHFHRIGVVDLINKVRYDR